MILGPIIVTKLKQLFPVTVCQSDFKNAKDEDLHSALIVPEWLYEIEAVFCPFVKDELWLCIH